MGLKLYSNLENGDRIEANHVGATERLSEEKEDKDCHRDED